MSQVATAPRIISGLASGQSSAPTGSKPLIQLDQRTYDRALDCVHCGLCLPACPTYTQNGLEADSPRGRIYLMKGMADGKIEPSPSVLEHLDLCLDCRACETACPSGVVYHELIEATRASLGSERSRGFVDRAVELIFFHLFPYPNRLKMAIAPLRILQKVGLWRWINAPAVRRLLPAQFEKMQQMLPSAGPVWESELAEYYPAEGGRQATVGMLAGCVGSVMFQHVNRQTIRLLQHAGCDVVVPKDQHCCGAIHHHGGHVEEAEIFARANVDVFAPPTQGHRVDWLVNNIAGCGAMLKDYAHLLRDDQRYRDRASWLSEHTRDISELLAQMELGAPPHPIEEVVTYHDACHLAHAQKVTAPPRQLLASIKGLRIRDLPESDMCCGAAGTYNLSQPEMARQLAERKIEHVRSTGARRCITGNVGCAMQIQSEADRLGVPLEVTHPVTLLYEAHFGSTDT